MKQPDVPINGTEARLPIQRTEINTRETTNTIRKRCKKSKIYPFFSNIPISFELLEEISSIATQKRKHTKK